MTSIPDPFANRAFTYGDGIFETIRVLDGKILFEEDHFLRLSYGMKTLELENADLSEFSKFSALISEFAGEAGLRNARIRLQVFRENGGFYTPVGRNAHYHLSVFPVDSQYMDGDGIRISDYRLQYKAPGVLSPLKSTSALLYVHASQWAKQQGYDDAFIFNSAERVIESTRSNVFVVTKGRIVTPPLSEGMVDGVMRKQVMQILGDSGSEVYEMPVMPEDLEMADEIWLTNVVKGLDWVREYQGKTYDQELMKEAAGWILSTINN